MAETIVRRYHATPIGYAVPILIEATYEIVPSALGVYQQLVYGSVRYLETEATSSFVPTQVARAA